MLEVTREEMNVLVNLQANEDDKNKIQAFLRKIPEQIAAIDQMLAEAEEQMRDREQLWDTRKKKYREYESEIKLKQEGIRKSDQKLMSIKSNKEYQAVLTEIEDLKRQIGKVEDDMLKTLFELEEQEKHLDGERKAWEEDKAQFQEEKQALEARRQQEEQQLSALEAAWGEIAGNVPRPLMDRYLEVRSGVSGGKALAAVRDYVCQGCYMNIPAQMYNELHTTNVLRFCPFCNRIVYLNGNRAEE